MGGTYFFTLTLQDRKSNLLVRDIDRFRAVYQRVAERHPFGTVAICILPDHLHAVWTLPDGDADFAQRWSLIKRGFSTGLDAPMDRTPSKIVRREKGIWQRRFWEHQIRDEKDLENHINYTYFNPVKHGYVQRVADWPHSSFHRDVARGDLPRDWAGVVEPIRGAFGE
jgi:putative transposase